MYFMLVNSQNINKCESRNANKHGQHKYQDIPIHCFHYFIKCNLESVCNYNVAFLAIEMEIYTAASTK